MSLRRRRAWWLGWPAACLYATVVHPIAGVALLVCGAWLTWRSK